MGPIQSGINSAISSTTRSIALAKHLSKERMKSLKAPSGESMPSAVSAGSPQATAASQANESMQNEIEAKRIQREQIDALSTSLGGKVEDLPEVLRNKIYEELGK